MVSAVQEKTRSTTDKDTPLTPRKRNYFGQKAYSSGLPPVTHRKLLALLAK